MKMTVEDDRFPVGMRVLVVDDDPTCLKLMEGLLRKCDYHVTTTKEAKEALKMLKENRNKFDIVICDVHMPDMDGFHLLQLVGLEMDLPVIMLSAYGDTKLVMKGIRNGACDYLLKPVRIQELQNIWQHVVRRNRSSVTVRRPPPSAAAVEGGRTPAPTSNDGRDHEKCSEENADGGRGGGDSNDDDDEDDGDSEEGGRENEDPTAQKKPRLFWSADLHQKFVDAINTLGPDKAFPKKILDVMNVEGLTREKVASHLQKFRLYLRKQKATSSQSGNRMGLLGGDDGGHIGALGGGYGVFRSLAGASRFQGGSSSSLTHQHHHHHHQGAGGGMLGRLNTAAGLSMRGGGGGLSSCAMVQRPSSQYNPTTTTPPPLAKYDHPVNLSSLVRPPSTSISTSTSTPTSANSIMTLLNGNLPHLSRGFATQTSLDASSSNIGALEGTCSYSKWGTSVVQPHPNSPFPSIVSGDASFHTQNNIQNDPLEYFCGIDSREGLPTGVNSFNNVAQSWQDQRSDYMLNSCNNNSNNNMSTSASSSQITAVGPSDQNNNNNNNRGMVGMLEDVPSQLLEQPPNEVEKSNNNDVNLRFDENYLLEDDTTRLLCASSTQNSCDYLEDIVGRFLKQGNGEMAPTGEDFWR